MSLFALNFGRLPSLSLGPLPSGNDVFPTFHLKKETGSVSTVVEFLRDSGTAAFVWGRMEMTCTVSTPPKNYNGNRSAPACLLIPSRSGRAREQRTLGVLVRYASVGGCGPWHLRSANPREARCIFHGWLMRQCACQIASCLVTLSSYLLSHVHARP